MSGSREHQSGPGEGASARPSWRFSGRRGSPVDLTEQQPDNLPTEVRTVIQKIARERAGGAASPPRAPGGSAAATGAAPPVAGAPVPVERRAPRVADADVRITPATEVPGAGLELVPHEPPAPAAPDTAAAVAAAPAPAAPAAPDTAAAPAPAAPVATGEEFGSDWLMSGHAVPSSDASEEAAAARALAGRTIQARTTGGQVPLTKLAGAGEPHLHAAPPAAPAAAAAAAPPTNHAGEHPMQHDDDPATTGEPGSTDGGERSGAPRRPLTPAEKKARLKARARKRKELEKARAKAAKKGGGAKPQRAPKRGATAAGADAPPTSGDATELMPLDPGAASEPAAAAPRPARRKQAAGRPMSREQKARLKAKAKARSKRGGAGSAPVRPGSGGGLLSKLFHRGGAAATPAETVDAGLEDASFDQLEPGMATPVAAGDLAFPAPVVEPAVAEMPPPPAEPAPLPVAAAPAPAMEPPAAPAPVVGLDPAATPAAASAAPAPSWGPAQPGVVQEPVAGSWTAPVSDVTPGAAAELPDVPALPLPPAADLAQMPAPVDPAALVAQATADLANANAPQVPDDEAPASAGPQSSQAGASQAPAPAHGVTVDEPVLPGEQLASPVAAAAEAVELIGAPVMMSSGDPEPDAAPDEPGDIESAGIWGAATAVADEPTPAAPQSPVVFDEPLPATPSRARTRDNERPASVPAAHQPAPAADDAAGWAPGPQAPRQRPARDGEDPQRSMRRTYQPSELRGQEAEIRERIEAKRRQLDEVFSSLGTGEERPRRR